MIKILELLRSYLTRVYGILFSLIILSAILAYFLALAGSPIGLNLVLAILFLANLLVILI